MMRPPEVFRVLIREAIRKFLDRLADRIDRAYALRGIPKRKVVKDQCRIRTTDRDRVCPVCGKPFRGFRELCRVCRRKDERA